MPTPSPTDRLAPSTPSSTPSTSSFAGDPTPSHASRSNDTYVYGVGILAVLAIGVCVYFLDITLSSLKLKKLSMIARRPSMRKSKINNQCDVLCFRFYIMKE